MKCPACLAENKLETVDGYLYKCKNCQTVGTIDYFSPPMRRADDYEWQPSGCATFVLLLVLVGMFLYQLYVSLTGGG